jgi:hypothetical protein
MAAHDYPAYPCAAAPEHGVVRRFRAHRPMNASETQLTEEQPRFRVLHAFCVAIALLSILPTLFVTVKFTQNQGVLIMAFSAFTLLFGHLSRFLGRRALRPAESSGRFYTSVALCVGYVCVLVGLLSQFFL